MAQEKKLHVLIADDSAVSREVLTILLKRLGHTVITAENGADGVEKFRTERPDVVLMDALMPVMNGYEATRQIKALAGDHWVPVIFLSGLENQDDLLKGLEAGGDDYLAKPVNEVILSAKLRSLALALSMQARLQHYYDTAEEENLLAREILTCQVHGQRLNDPRLHYWMEPTHHFSGDVVAAVHAADGRMIVMLADATGHGLAAAISVLQVFNLFNALADINLPLTEIVRELNNRIRETMPVGRFVAASFVSFDMMGGRGEIWNGGMPAALWINATGQVTRRFVSQHLPLGIGNSDASESGKSGISDTEVFDCRDGGQLLLYSDGLIEAENADHVAFGDARLLTAIAASSAATARCEAIRHAVQDHLADVPAHDDISLVVIDMVA